DTLKNAIETKKAFNKLDFRIVMPNGNIRWIRSSGALIFDDNNNLIKIIKTSLDITDQKLLQEQLIHSEKLSAVGQLTAGVAHEFNNLLTIIYNTALLMELEENKPLPNLIKIIYDTVKRGADIVSNMMAFAKPSAPKRELTKIENIIDKVLKLQEQQLFLENIEIEKRYNNTNDVLIDTGQFQQVFLNIIINARHAIIPKEKGKIIISTETRDNNVLIKISDNGIGIAPENIDKIFNPFFTTKGAYSQDDLGIKGSGLGLSVTQTIIQNHNGAISVESKKDAGSTFIITLPLPEKEFEKKIIESSKKTISEKNGNKKLKVLIVDDEQFILNSMTRILKLHNCEVYSALTGAEALNLAQKTKLDVIFLDMLLPQMTGEKILKEIK
ncbi:MAG TPA: ATP-binding protein, partial [bacterium]|nr:ATP-binding protein [bacterium]